MSLRRVAAIIVRQYFLMRSSVSRLSMHYLWISVDIVLWGLISRYLNSLVAAGLNLVPAFLGVVLLWDFCIRVMQGVAMAFFEDVWSRNFLNIFTSPIKISEYVYGLVATGILTSLTGLVLMLVLASVFFGLDWFFCGLMCIPFLLVLLVFGTALGIVGCAVVLRFGPAAEWFIWPVATLIAPFAGVFYPVSTLPVWMQPVAHLLPPAYVFEGVRAIVLRGGGVSAFNLGIGCLLSLLYLALACWAFIHNYRHAVRSGLIVRYSAETLG